MEGNFSVNKFSILMVMDLSYKPFKLNNRKMNCWFKFTTLVLKFIKYSKLENIEIEVFYLNWKWI